MTSQSCALQLVCEWRKVWLVFHQHILLIRAVSAFYIFSILRCQNIFFSYKNLFYVIIAFVFVCIFFAKTILGQNPSQVSLAISQTEITSRVEL